MYKTARVTQNINITGPAVPTPKLPPCVLEICGRLCAMIAHVDKLYRLTTAVTAAKAVA